MTFDEAARRQYLRSSYYTVYLTGPNGERIHLGDTPRKTGRGLLAVLGRGASQGIIRETFGAAADQLTFEKSAGCLTLSNGWRIVFGGTIRQEAADGPT